MAWDPDLFLWFHDTFVDRNKRHKEADWRKNVYGVEYKILAVGYIGFGLFLVVGMVKRWLNEALVLGVKPTHCLSTKGTRSDGHLVCGYVWHPCADRAAGARRAPGR